MSDATPDLVLDDAAAPREPGDDVVRLDDPEYDKSLPARAAVQEDGSVKLALLFPVTLRTQKSSGEVVDSKNYSELVFTRLTGADMRAIANVDKGGDRTGVMFARSTRTMQRLADVLFDKLDGADVIAAMAVLNHFLPSGD